MKMAPHPEHKTKLCEKMQNKHVQKLSDWCDNVGLILKYKLFREAKNVFDWIVFLHGFSLGRLFAVKVLFEAPLPILYSFNWRPLYFALRAAASAALLLLRPWQATF